MTREQFTTQDRQLPAKATPTVSGGRLETVRAVIEAHERGDVEGMLPLLDENVEWVPATVALAGDHPRRGHEGVRRWFYETAVVWQDFSWHPRELSEVDDLVVVTGEVRARDQGGRQNVVPVRWTYSFAADRVASMRAEVEPDTTRTGER